VRSSTSARDAPRPPRLRALAAAALALVLLAAGCGTPAGGDPGGRRLRELGRDPVFAARPPAATGVGVTRTPARYRRPGFQTGGWDGAGVKKTFTSTAPPAEVFRFYARRAAAAGWHAGSTGSLGLTDSWTKTYPDGAPATLVLLLLTPPGAGAARLYSLAGGIAPVAH
jgi:hypothetical protein